MTIDVDTALNPQHSLTQSLTSKLDALTGLISLSILVCKGEFIRKPVQVTDSTFLGASGHVVAPAKV